MSKLNFFFDVDGTLIPFGGEPSESVFSSLKSLRDSGHRIFLSSGRSPVEMDRRLSSIHFNGGVYCSGALSIIDGKEIWKKTFSQKEREEIFNYAERNEFLLIIQKGDGTYTTREGYDYFNRLLSWDHEIPGIKVVNSLTLSGDVFKFLFLSKDGKCNRLREDLLSYTVVDNTDGVDQSLMKELTLSSIDKVVGVKKILEYLGEDKDSIVAFGDGVNDIEMIKYSGLGIAMGNGCNKLKGVADYITTTDKDDGVKNGIEYALKMLKA